ncbi:hypothetical protein NQZ68_024366 [Dissostichus eleginoides]|nr:hypothetical protein NQZ68_024366 [Dissostichus eleginoides]
MTHLSDNTSTRVVQAEQERERGGGCLAALAQAELPSAGEEEERPASFSCTSSGNQIETLNGA